MPTEMRRVEGAQPRDRRSYKHPTSVRLRIPSATTAAHCCHFIICPPLTSALLTSITTTSSCLTTACFTSSHITATHCYPLLLTATTSSSSRLSLLPSSRQPHHINPTTSSCLTTAFFTSSHITAAHNYHLAASHLDDGHLCSATLSALLLLISTLLAAFCLTAILITSSCLIVGTHRIFPPQYKILHRILFRSVPHHVCSLNAVHCYLLLSSCVAGSASTSHLPT